MVKQQAIAKAQQIHDVLQLMQVAIDGLLIRDGHPINGVVSMLIDQSQDVANKLSDPAEAGDAERDDMSASGSKEDV
ncbi:hypothetical protein AWB80_03370 [Caballeronia pedi]|uniref:Uncharacterized protein n=1 Tax=Caballeronia pedi TaxID=1777141 RepID=A0A158BCY7_9BURK|nr:hypothetical protein [Caballeronia pedi]SAK67931.1 hypothetical protein AWB80_03370 [Caballeronia pedi]